MRKEDEVLPELWREDGGRRMTLDEAIKRYTDNAEYERTHGNLQGCLDFRQLAEWLSELKQLRERTKWIPVSERLPKPYGQVLRTVKSVGWNGTFNIYVDMGAICPIDTNVIAWMPLPEPYEPQVNEDEIVSLEFSEDIDTPGKFQTKDGVWHTATF